ncbi:hypothetical protein F5144DRAFT_588966 [Chaetomium tenue]|uniref:Uncharacterized protein n=1 Tax=Chaetomium tenue TaxID=1854479 RepID=A0ACB7PNR0_9PEZI|nr:hypothetical protein F5144DRAFT_588966 [Chaetomium globosum]
MSAPSDQRRRQQESAPVDPRRRVVEAPRSNPTPRSQPTSSGNGPTSSGRPTASAPSAARPPPSSYDDDGPAPPEEPIDDYDRAEDTRDDEIAQHWEQWYQRIEEEYTYPVIIDQEVGPDIFRLLGSEPPLFNVQRKARLGQGFGGEMGSVKVALLDGDSLDDVKDAFRGKKATVIINGSERSAFAPTRMRSSAAAELENAPPPVPAPTAQLPIRTSAQSNAGNQSAPRREERREAPRGGGQGSAGRGGGGRGVRDAMNHQGPLEPPPPYSRLSSPRPPPIDAPPEFASGQPNRLCAWDFSNLPDQGSSSASTLSGGDDTLPLNNPDAFAHQDIFEEHSIVEHVDVVDDLNSPFTRRPEHGKEIVVVSSLSPTWLHCHHKVFPAFWKCMVCPPNDCFSRWDIHEMEEQARNYRPSCYRVYCVGPATRQSVLVNTQKESIMTLSGQNLMTSRAEEPLMWCCHCTGFRSRGGGHHLDCAHCANFEGTSCRDCVRCNKFLEPTNFGNGEMVQFGVAHLHARGLAILAGTKPADGRRAMVMLKTAYGLDDPVRAWWVVACSSLILGHSLYNLALPALPVLTTSLGQPTVPPTPPESTCRPDTIESACPSTRGRHPPPEPTRSSHNNSHPQGDDIISFLNQRHPYSGPQGRVPLGP